LLKLFRKNVDSFFPDAVQILKKRRSLLLFMMPAEENCDIYLIPAINIIALHSKCRFLLQYWFPTCDLR